MAQTLSLKFRGLLRRTNIGLDRSSFPFLSGDTYKNFSNYSFRDEADVRIEFEKLVGTGARGKLFLTGFQAIALAEELKLKSSIAKTSLELVIHNWDNIPSPPQMETLRETFARMYSVNWLGSRDICTPIPIGLENADFWMNGVPEDFAKIIGSNLPDFGSRKFQILCNFSVATNPGVRQSAIDFFSKVPGAITTQTFKTPRVYQHQVSNTQFVVSPPGNGADCHRTWESIYLGSVPIVLRAYWPFSDLPLPVIVVEDWSDAPEAIRNYKPIIFEPVERLKELFFLDFM